MSRRKIEHVKNDSFMTTMDKAIAAESVYWGYHLLLDAQGCTRNIADGEQVKLFIKELVKELKMKAVGETAIYHFGEGKRRDLSAIQLITTSTITIHTDSTQDRIFLDVFSCKEYDKKIVFPLFRSFFGPQRIASVFVLRNGANIKVEHVNEQAV